MLLSSCTTVDLVEKLSDDGAEYCRLPVMATAVAAFGRVLEGTHLAAVRALRATAPAVDRIASIVSVL